MENSVISASRNKLKSVWEKTAETVRSDKHKYEMIACLTAGILFGCVTRAIYGNGGDWNGVLAGYCSGFAKALLSVTPATVIFLACVFFCAPFRITRLLIYPGIVFRGMGFGALICGAVQCGSLRELCFSALALQPFAAASCVIAVYAGEYALGLNEAFSGENKGMTRSLLLHCAKMGAFYLLLSVLSCVIFAGTCRLFGLYLI